MRAICVIEPLVQIYVVGTKRNQCLSWRLTGEITLRGRVLLISGLKGKLLAKLYRGGHPRPPNFMRFPRRNAPET